MMVIQHPMRLLLTLATAVASIAFTPGAGAGIFDGCVDDVTGTFKPNQVPNNCTANDVTFTVVGLGTQTDGCFGPGDTVTLFLGARVRNTTAQTRYDIGLYIATDGDPNGDGAKTGACFRDILTPLGAVGVQTCPPLDLDGGSGPYLNVDGDSCGDLFDESEVGCDESGANGSPIPDGDWDESFIVFPDPVTLPCRDIDPDGFINIPTCSTWGNQVGEVGDGTCDGATEVIPGTKAKCMCADTNSTVPMPNLSLSCACDRTTVAPTESTTCTVTYTNNVTCVPDPLTPERFQCGTASFMRFEVDYDQANGAVSNAVPTRGSVADDGNLLSWIPASAASDTAGIIGANGETSTLTFDYTLAAGVPEGTAISFTTNTFWSNTSASDPTAVQQTLSCTLGFTATPVTLAWVDSRREAGEVVLEWATATEAGNLGFHVYGDTPAGRRRLDPELIASRVVDSTEPQSYRLRIPDLGTTAIYLEDVDTRGQGTLHGPFLVGETHGRRPQPEAIDWGTVRSTARAAAARQEGLRPAMAAARAGGPAPAAVPIELRVDRDALYRVTWEDLTAAGFDLTGVRSRDLAVESGGEPVPIRVEGPSTFGPGAYLELVGEGLDTLYTDSNVYTLRVDPQQALRMETDRRPVPNRGASAAFYRETVRGGRDLLYAFSSPTDDPWYDSRLLVLGQPQQWSFDFEVDHRVAGAAPAALSLDLWGVTDWSQDLDHHLRVQINGTEVADERFDGFGAHPVTVELPASLLQEGTNTLTLELPADTGAPADLINLDGFELSYPRALAARPDGLRFTAAGEVISVSELPHDGFRVYRLGTSGPVLLDKVELLATADGVTATFAGTPEPAEYLLAPAVGRPVAEITAGRPALDLAGGTADYLIIAHPAFLGGLDRLVAAREAQGLTVRVVDVTDVYAQVSHGVFDAGAIRDYIAQAAARSGVRYVLLVGADTFDYRDVLGEGSISFIPSLYAATGGVVRFAPVDPLYGDLDGDSVPDLPVGRFPVRTAAELASLIDKTLLYEAKGYGRTVVAAADGFDSLANHSFTQDSERFLAQLGSGWSAERAYIDSLGVAGARTRLRQSIDQGTALTSYIGHSGPTVWSFSGLFGTADASALGNAGRPSVVLQWGCWNTYHVEPKFNTLGHKLLLSGDRGAAAVLGSSTLMHSSSTRALAELLAPRLVLPGVRLGDALIQAKQELSRQQPGLLDVLLGWTLLGDPALVVEP